MTGGQNHVIFWTLRPNLTSRLGTKGKNDGTINATVGDGASEKAPETKSDEAALTSTSVEKAMEETFLCGVSVGKDDISVGNSSSSSCVSSGVTVTGTAKGAFVVWENFECVRMVPGAHGALLRGTRKRAVKLLFVSCKKSNMMYFNISFLFWFRFGVILLCSGNVSE